jgi:hypothetical protein
MCREDYEGMIDRRLFLKLTSSVAAASALGSLPVVANASSHEATDGGVSADYAGGAWQAPGTYLLSGRVRFVEPFVEISGIANSQQISWSPGSLSSPVASFKSYEHFAEPWKPRQIRVRGGQLEALTLVPLDPG